MKLVKKMIEIVKATLFLICALPAIVVVTLLWWMTQVEVDALNEWTKEL